MSARVGSWLVAVAVAAAALFAVVTAPRTPPPLGRDAAAPAFELPRLNGGTLSLSSLRGRVVLINFWATWCRPCEEEMPAMQRLYSALRDQDFELVAISVDDGREEVERFQARLGLSFPILLDPEKAAAQRYQTFRFPESFLLDRSGVIVERYIGPKEWDASAYVERVRRLLAEDPGARG